MLDAQTQTRVQNVQQRLHDRGVVDIKFFKSPEYYTLSPSAQANELCDVLEAVLDGRSTPAEPLGDSVRGLLGGDSSSPITLSPITRCGGESDTGDHNEEQQKGGTTAS